MINLTPHSLMVQRPDGSHDVIPPSGTVARVAKIAGERIADSPEGYPCYAPATWGDVEGLPAHVEPGVNYIVSASVAARCAGRPDVYAPASGVPGPSIRGGGQHLVVRRLVVAPGPGMPEFSRNGL